jgi:hypothetical protein
MTDDLEHRAAVEDAPMSTTLECEAAVAYELDRMWSWLGHLSNQHRIGNCSEVDHRIEDKRAELLAKIKVLMHTDAQEI